MYSYTMNGTGPVEIQIVGIKIMLTFVLHSPRLTHAKPILEGQTQTCGNIGLVLPSCWLLNGAQTGLATHNIKNVPKVSTPPARQKIASSVSSPVLSWKALYWTND
jgi:hypothetical protein